MAELRIPGIRSSSYPPIYLAAQQVAGRLRAGGFQAYFAGGFARDHLIGRPIHDIDIATNATPDTVMELFPGSRGIGKSFGVIQVPVHDHFFEVATFRRDVGSQDGRHPEAVVFTTAEEDATRRDFTINGMFFDPFTFEIIDYVGGARDIERRSIRSIGEPGRRFAEDYLRVMRAVRFASVLQFSIEPGTWKALREWAPRLTEISAERLRDELMRTLMEAPKPGTALTLLRDAGILAIILPEVQAMNGVEQPPEFHPEGDVFTHTALMLDLMRERSPELIWAILMHDIAKPATFAMGTDKQGQPRIQFYGHADLGAEMGEEIMRRFRCSNEEIAAVKIAVKNHMRFSAVPEMRESTRRRWVGSPHFPLELELHRVDCLSSHGSLEHYDQILAFQKQISTEPVLPPPLINGRDLMSLGMAGGPAMGQALRQIYDAQLEEAFRDREGALVWLREHWERLSNINEGPGNAIGH